MADIKFQKAIKQLNPHRVMAFAALVTFAAIVARALLTFDPYFDTVAYHLPFAARLADLCTVDCYRMGDYLEAAYAGFPKLLHVLQGWLWKITGSPQYADVLNVLALLLFCWFLRRVFRVPATWAFCALLAVPLLQIHLTSTYVDVPVNIAIATAILGIFVLLRDPARFSIRMLILILVCLAFASNSKPQMIAAAVPVFALLAVVLLWFFHRGRRIETGAAQLYLILLAGGTLIGANALLNTIAHGNPLYPVELQVGPFLFEGPMRAMKIGEDSLAPMWLEMPSALRWLASVLEIGAFEFREVPWTYDQGYCATALSWKHCAHEAGMGFRMGGYFVPYVLSLLLLGAWALRGRTDRRALSGIFLFATLLAAFLPRSHELRYYMFWMIALVASVLIAVFERDEPNNRMRAVCAAVILTALVSVVALTHGRYLDPSAPDLREVMALKDITKQVEAIPAKAVVCVDAGRQPFTSLYAPVHHPPREYGILDGPIGDCTYTVTAPKEE